MPDNVPHDVLPHRVQFSGDACASNRPLRTVFLIGTPRSGTTLLAYLLGGAGGTLSLSEPHLARAILPNWKFQRLISQIQRQNRLQRVRLPLHISEPGLLSMLESLARRNQFGLLAIKETFRWRVARPEWDNDGLLDTILRKHPTLLLIRHPFDVAASTVKLCRWATGWRGRLLRLRWPGVPFFADSTEVVRWAAENWRQYAEWIREFPAAVLRYEDLVTDTPAALARVCEILGIAFDPAMLSTDRPRTAFGGIGDPGVMLKPNRPIDQAAIGRGNLLSPEQREIVRAACEDAAGMYSYELDER